MKICGLTRTEDAREAVAAGADYLGFVFYPRSRRRLPREAAGWIRGVSGAAKVGVFRDQERDVVERVRGEAALDLVQLHGEEPPALCAALGGRERVIKAIGVAGGIDWARVAEYAEVARVLFDTATPGGGGSGRVFDWSLLAGRAPDLDFWLAGGLAPGNVVRAITQARPAGVDVASGVEAAVGVKDPAKIRAFIAAVRRAEARRRGPGTGNRGPRDTDEAG